MAEELWANVGGGIAETWADVGAGDTESWRNVSAGRITPWGDPAKFWLLKEDGDLLVTEDDEMIYLEE